MLIVLIASLINGCSSSLKYFPVNSKLHKKVNDIKPIFEPWNHKHYNQFKKKTEHSKFDGYIIEFIRIEPYYIITSNFRYSEIRLIPEVPWARKQGFTSRKNYYDPYTFIMFTLNQEAYNKNLLPYFNIINTSYETKLNLKDINKFVKYECDKNIVFSKYERDKYYKPLEATCYVKRLDKDVFLITRFAHPNTQEDRVLFENEIIPTMLESIKVTPTKLSPWK
jgi:hypothetical protein